MTDDIKRPAPKVLDADGVEISVGDRVWTKAGTGMVVTLVESDKRVVMDCARGGRGSSIRPTGSPTSAPCWTRTACPSRRATRLGPWAVTSKEEKK